MKTTDRTSEAATSGFANGRKPFALVLAVVVVILSGTYFWIAPAMSKPREKLQRFFGYKIVDRTSRADIDFRNISAALEAFRSCYGHYPNAPAVNSLNEVNHSELMAILTGQTNILQAFSQNPKGLHFLTLSAQPRLEYQDPWGHAYHIEIDTNDAGAVMIGNQKVAKPFAVWSDGPNKLNEYGGGDDLRSW
jgi:hypothetical protein